MCIVLCLRAGSLVVGTREKSKRATEGGENGARKSEPPRELLSFEFRPSRGVIRSAFHMCQAKCKQK